MDNQTLYLRYLKEGTAGYAIVRKFHTRYDDVIEKVGFATIDDLLHDILLSLAGTDTSYVHSIDHYILRAVKLRCWAILDKALRHKARYADIPSDSDDPLPSGMIQPEDQSSVVEGMELIGQMSLFKTHLPKDEIRLLNFLIDDADRSEMAERLNMNINTLDTNIRRLRMKFAEFLHRQGYVYPVLERFMKR